ncbi:metallophosphoesterase [Pontibacter toksunensis]|uniref:Metallophosphoesterase n=1 Tax=Pontibacter toksunensis TaxID=1332631 RepID=A0ABW6BU62_9BACT
MKRNNMKWALGVLALGAAGLVLLDSLFLEKYFFEVKPFDIGNKSRGGKKLRILLLTDLHFRHHLFPYYRKLAAKVNQLQPDLLFVTGDTLDSTGIIKPMDEFFSLLDQQIQKVAIPGNNDYKADRSLEHLKAAYEKHQVDFLVNESKAYSVQGTRVMVTGLDDFIEGESHFKKVVKEVGREEHHLLLVHSPLQQEAVKEKITQINRERSAADQLNIRYVFAGHTHGGQIRLPGYVPVLPGMSGDYVNGWYNDSAPFLYVSRGFGASTIPMRFDARSEVTLFNYYT